jgi:hypothetical protein
MKAISYVFNIKGAIYISFAFLLAGPSRPYAFFLNSEFEVFLFLAGFQDLFVRTVQLILGTAEFHPAGGVTCIGRILLNPKTSIATWLYPLCGGHVFMVPIWVGSFVLYWLLQANTF